MNFCNLFFSPIVHNEEIDFTYQKNLLHYRTILNTQANLSGLCIYLIDYVEKKFAYIPNYEPLLLGYSISEVEQLGISFFQSVLYPEDIGLFQKINEKGFEFLYSLDSVQDKLNYLSVFDLRVIDKEKNVHILNFKFRPFVIDENGNLLLSMVYVNYSTNSRPGNYCIHFINKKQIFKYSEKEDKFIETKKPKLSAKEKDVLVLMSQGFLGKEIVDKLCIKQSTYKYYIKSIFYKLNVSNSKEAIYLFSQMGHDL